MSENKSVACVIPARMASSRLPGKILKTIGDKSLLEWIYLSATNCEMFETVVFAVDDLSVLDHVKSFGGKAVMTRIDHKNGTSRISELLEKGIITSDIIVNWQGDEPFIHKAIIEDLLQSVHLPGDIWTLRKKVEELDKIQDENIVKVVCGKEDRALYFSRSMIPFPRDSKLGVWYKHIGLYAYTQEALKRINSLRSCFLEETESLEQLRFLHEGMLIKAHITEHETLGIDTKENLIKAQELLTTLNKTLVR